MQAGVEARYEPDLLVLHERANQSEYWSRCWTYGFGIGVCIVLWLSDGDRWAWRLLRAWIGMRARLLVRSRRPQAAVEELRVLLGTVHGLWRGRRLRQRPENRTRLCPG